MIQNISKLFIDNKHHLTAQRALDMAKKAFAQELNTARQIKLADMLGAAPVLKKIREAGNVVHY